MLCKLLYHLTVLQKSVTFNQQLPLACVHFMHIYIYIYIYIYKGERDNNSEKKM